MRANADPEPVRVDGGLTCSHKLRGLKRLREAGVPQRAIIDLLRHATKTITLPGPGAQIVDLNAWLEKLRDANGRWNMSIAMLKREHEAACGVRVPR